MKLTSSAATSSSCKQEPPSLLHTPPPPPIGAPLPADATPFAAYQGPFGDAGEVDLHADAAPWWLLQRCLLLEQLDALETFMALVDRSAHNTKLVLQG